MKSPIEYIYEAIDIASVLIAITIIGTCVVCAVRWLTGLPV